MHPQICTPITHMYPPSPPFYTTNRAQPLMVEDKRNGKREQKKDIRQTPLGSITHTHGARQKRSTPENKAKGSAHCTYPLPPNNNYNKTNAARPEQGQHKQKQGAIVANMQIYYEKPH